MTRVYCAGPLFNDPERAEMAAIAATLEAAGYETFLPQRDGFELAPLQRQFEADGVPRDRAAELLHRAIFDLDIYHLLRWSDACVANFNGRVPDDGTVVEAALTWGAARPLVIYKADERSSFDGLDNPMLTCLTGLEMTDSIEALPAALDRELSRDRSGQLAGTMDRGEQIAATGGADPAALAQALRSLYD